MIYRIEASVQVCLMSFVLLIHGISRMCRLPSTIITKLCRPGLNSRFLARLKDVYNTSAHSIHCLISQKILFRPLFLFYRPLSASEHGLS
jgi:hypothetical protein